VLLLTRGRQQLLTGGPQVTCACDKPRSRRRITLAALPVVAATLWQLVNLRSETAAVPYLNDSAMHEQMVRFATAQLAAGHLPPTRWYPLLGLGSPQFLHYQSLAAMLTGLAGIVVGPNVAFRWSLYLLVSLWPVSVYTGARLFGASRRAAAIAAALSPLLSSTIGVGYETKAYTWIGYGVWAQLWAADALPLAWGLCWRALRDGIHVPAATICVALTVALHFETGYLALLPLLLWPLTSWPPSKAWTRGRRALIVATETVVLSAWVLVPLVQQRHWAAVNEILQRTPLVKGYGLGHVLAWLGSGQLFDHGGLPLITVLGAVGAATALFRHDRAANARPLLVLLVATVILASGPATFGPLMSLIPGHHDIFFRRFMMGTQLAGLLLAGAGADWLSFILTRAFDRLFPADHFAPAFTQHWQGPLLAISGFALLSVCAIPAIISSYRYDRTNAQAISAQASADAATAPDLDRLIAYIRAHGGGRTYAGAHTNFGRTFTIGAVPVYSYLADHDIDAVGFALRTASLMSVPEYYFDPRQPSDYLLFAVRYLILPTGARPPVAAQHLMTAGNYALWQTKVRGYLQVGTLRGSLDLSRADIGTRSLPALRSTDASSGIYVGARLVDAGSSPLPAQTNLSHSRSGEVLAEHDHLQRGSVVATVRMRRAGVLVLSASYDPGWQVTVDGKLAKPFMVAPALVAVPITKGRHDVEFRYVGYKNYPLLLVLGAVDLLAVGTVGVIRPLRLVARRKHLRTAAATEHHTDDGGEG